jgi:hypothetical protein
MDSLWLPRVPQDVLILQARLLQGVRQHSESIRVQDTFRHEPLFVGSFRQTLEEALIPVS